MIERVDTWTGIMAVGNVVRSRFHHCLPGIATTRADVEGYDVYLPGYYDRDYEGYARYLLAHPHPAVHLHYTKADL
jgi:hypothetical protein